MDAQDEENSAANALSEAQRTVARQAEEIEQLKRRLADEHFAEDLRKALTQAAVAGTIASPVSHARLLEMIVETAASVIGARAASLFLIDHASQQLTFEVALGEKAAEVKRFTVPLGHGIAESDQEKIFERFVQVGGPRAHRQLGLGLGLYICSEIIKRPLWRLWVESQLDNGSTFHFTLPVAK